MKQSGHIAYNVMSAKVSVLPELQSTTQEELDALLPSVLGRVFNGEL